MKEKYTICAFLRLPCFIWYNGLQLHLFSYKWDDFTFMIEKYFTLHTTVSLSTAMVLGQSLFP